MKLFKLILTVYLTTFFSGCDDGLRLYATYENVDQARVDGAYARGWFPEWFPRDAINIHEYHDLDTNSQVISFEIAEPNNFQWPEFCNSAKTVTRSRLKTRLFPAYVHSLDGIRECGKFFMVKGQNGLFHMWR